ncbi:MAG: hypothetical protein AABY15_04500 [Nanoarchaeota archaeon]
MIQKTIREFARKNNKKISKKAIKKINEIIEKKVESIILQSARNADFLGRIVIDDSDVAEQ